ncbi:MAG TPA: 6-phosphogluconolactonase [Nitrolancea sp.]|jgi:6-phosphogluconolactonase|nr:6-phosphogluconolactonase [Nitrolancea sp.]
MSETEIIVEPTTAALAQAAADRFVTIVAQRQRQGGVARIALSGGSTPRALFTLLASPEYASKIDWHALEIFWGDERTVPPDHSDSNYRMSQETLLSKVPVNEQRIHRMRGELESDAAAADYSLVLQQVFELTGEHAMPQFDLILLGIGPDGHTASLFPHTSALAERELLVVANPVPQQQTTRLTLTVPVLQAASTVVFLVAGADKAPAVRLAIEGEWNPAETPSQYLREASGKVIWMLDAAAAAQLTDRPAG